MVEAGILRLSYLRERETARNMPDYLRALARKIEKGERKLSNQEIELVEEFYATIVEARKDSFLRKLKGAILLLYVWARFGFNYVIDLADAIHTLNAAITDLVERQSEGYRSLVHDLLKKANTEGKELTAGELNAIFRKFAKRPPDKFIRNLLK